MTAFMFSMESAWADTSLGATRLVTDNDLIRQADRGDASAFATLVRRHYNRILKFAMRSLRNRADAEDIAQDVCLKLWAKLAGFDRDSNFVAWLYAITLNTIRSHLRRVGNGARNVDLGDWSDILIDDTAISPERHTMAKQAILKMMTLLSAREQEAVLLVYSEGLKHAEAGVAMGCSEATVSGYVHTARQKIVAEALSRSGVL